MIALPPTSVARIDATVAAMTIPAHGYTISTASNAAKERTRDVSVLI